MPLSSVQHTDGSSTLEDAGRDISVPKPQLTAKGVALTATFWLLYSTLIAFIVTRTEDAPLVSAVAGQLTENTIMAVTSIPVWWLVIRRMDQVHWGWICAVHLLIAPAYAWGTVEAFVGICRLTAPEGVTKTLNARYPWLVVSHITLYIIQFAVFHLTRSVNRLRIKEQQTTELLARARQQELAALKAQINPHFLFNTLNSISATLTRDPDQAREMIAKLARMMRYALDSSNRDVVSLGDEINFAKQYLALERHRFSDRLAAKVNVPEDDEVWETPVPPMVLQPLIENALRHGIAPSEDGGTVRVEVSQTDGAIDVRVEDTGIGADTPAPLSSDSEGVGLANTSARLERTYGPEAALETAPNTPTGFAVWFSIPKDGASTPSA